MLRSACSHIIVVDVTAPDDVELTNYGDALSGWYMLWKKWNPFTSAVKIPTQNDIQERLAFCSHYKNLEALKSNPHYEYIFPPVGHFSRFLITTLSFRPSFEEKYFQRQVWVVCGD